MHVCVCMAKSGSLHVIETGRQCSVVRSCQTGNTSSEQWLCVHCYVNSFHQI